MKLDVTMTPEELAQFIVESLKARYPRDEIGMVNLGNIGFISNAMVTVTKAAPAYGQPGYGSPGVTGPGRTYNFNTAAGTSGALLETP